MKEKEERELVLLKEYNKYLNEEGTNRLVELWNKSDLEREELRKNGM